MVEILCRRQKNNPCLVGEPGVGKTALAEGLAQRIASRNVPRMATCVGLRYGYSTNNSGFSWQLAHTFPYFSSVCITSSDCHADLPARLLPRLPRDSIPASALPLRPHSSVILQYRNFNLLSIGYVFRPHLRPRLTQSRSALLWKPWVFGRKDSHLPLATHSGILSS